MGAAARAPHSPTVADGAAEQPRPARQQLNTVGLPLRTAAGRAPRGAWLCAAAVLAAASLAAGAEDARRGWGGGSAVAGGGSQGVLPRDALLALRLKGGRGCTGTRNSCKQRSYKIKNGAQRDAKANRPIALSHKPCSGPRALSGIERIHGAAVIQQVQLPSPPFSPASKHALARGAAGKRLRLIGVLVCRLSGMQALGPRSTIRARQP